ncbi:MAG: hypothetical protein Q8M24_23475 [Pseudolabrys sp.]|nr:hypothetical protein [Pseudolabrys sp.]
MSNDNEIDHAEMEMMTELLQFKKKHGDAAYLALLSKFNVQRWSEIPSTAHGEVTMQCKAGVAGLTIEDVDDFEDDTPSIQDRLKEIAAKVYGTSKPNSDFHTIVNGAGSVAEGFDLIGRARNAGRKDVAG